MKLATIRELVPCPEIIDGHKLAAFTAALRRCGYDEDGCAKRLGVFPRLGVLFWDRMRPDWAARPLDLVDTLIELFIDAQPITRDRLAALPAGFVDDAIAMKLVVAEDDRLVPKLSLFPCHGKYIVTDRAAKNLALNQVMWLWGESYLLAGLVKRSPRRRAVDIGTGSGIHAILAAEHSQAVVAVDVNPRALEFVRFNAALNGIRNIEPVLSDVLGAVEGTFDLLTANPPYAPDDAAKAGDNFWSGGHDGMNVLRRIVEAIPRRLDRDGTAHIVALYPNPPGSTIRDHVRGWLAGVPYDVLDHTWPVPTYEDMLSEQPYSGDKSAWRFGVISLRASEGEGSWREPFRKALFFRQDGGCAVVADHDAPA